jgi:hypothetical protein
MRRVIAGLVSLITFGLFLYPATRADWLVTRELFHAAEATGIMPSGGGSFWGQIAGRNIPLHSPAFHIGVRFISMAVVFGAVLAISFAVPSAFGLVRRKRGATYCGRCGRVLANLVEPRCPHCGEPL